jgi:hypothetical protein
MQLTAAIHERRLHHHFVSSSPPTPAEAAAASVRWDRRGLLRRLVRLDAPLGPK